MQSKRAGMLLVGVFLLFIYGVPVTQALRELVRRERVVAAEVFTRTPTTDNLRAYERDLETASWVQNGVRPYLQYWRFMSMGDAGEKGIVGRDGWLFYKPGVDFLIQPWPAESGSSPNEALSAIESFRDQLKARGIALVLLIAPGKESVYPNELAPYVHGSVNGHVTQFIDTLRSHGIEVVYPGTDKDDTGALYLKQDTHWTPALAKDIADSVAKLIVDKGLIAHGDAQFDAKPVTLDRHGDILRMAKSQVLLNATAPEKITCEQVVYHDSGELYKDDPNSPVLVLGDSFLRMYQLDEPKGAGFIAHLARALGQPVASIVNDGGASTLVRQELQRKLELLKGKKVVIWEFVERDLRFGTDGWKDIQLAEK